MNKIIKNRTEEYLWRHNLGEGHSLLSCSEKLQVLESKSFNKENMTFIEKDGYFHIIPDGVRGETLET